MGKIFEGILENAKISRSVQDIMDINQKFNSAFHIRPNSRNFTIVSTLPVAPMRGIHCRTKQDLEEKLTLLKGSLDMLCSENDGKVLATLKELGFKQRGANGKDYADEKQKTELEEDVQIRFIRGMVKGEADYQGIQFVASEFIVQYNDEGKRLLRADVIGYDPQNETLYVFELKNGHEIGAIEQAQEYVDIIRENLEVFSGIIRNYPNIAFPPKALHRNKIVPVAVLRYAENISESTYKKQLAEHPEAQVWFYRDTLSFQKGFDSPQ